MEVPMKLRSVFALFALVLLASVAFAQSIETGEFTASPNQEGFSLNTGKGDRVYIETIAFDKGFTAPPKVHVFLSGFDAKGDETGAVRVHVSASKVTKTGFTLRVKTWGDGTVGSAWGTWMAVGVR
jgi:H-type lectin domain